MTDQVIYPRFLGMDGSGDFVWELASGRWTWGDDPHAAATRPRTFDPDEYAEKYGRPVVLGEQIDRRAEAGMSPDPGSCVISDAGGHRCSEPVLMTQPHDVPVGSVPVAGQQSVVEASEESISLTLYAVLAMLDSWIEGARSDHDGMGHRGEPRGEECWARFAPSDFRRMVNDVAIEMGVSTFPLPGPGQAKEDEVR